MKAVVARGTVVDIASVSRSFGLAGDRLLNEAARDPQDEAR